MVPYDDITDCLIPNAPVDQPLRDSYLETGGQPKPRPVVQGTGPNSDSDMAFNLRQRIYPDPYTSTADEKDLMSPASCRLLSAKEGHIGVHLGPIEPGQDSLVGNPPGAPGHPSLPHRHYEMPMDREGFLHNNPACRGIHKPLLDPVYNDNGQFNYDGVPYHLGINTGWYDPSGRAPDGQYSRYHPQYLLPPPFASCPYMNMYANDNPTMHCQPGTMARGHYTNPQLPLHSQHLVGYAEPSGSHEPIPGAYREAQYLHAMPPGPVAASSVEGGANQSADLSGTHPDDIAQQSEPLIHDAAAK